MVLPLTVQLNKSYDILETHESQHTAAVVQLDNNLRSISVTDLEAKIAADAADAEREMEILKMKKRRETVEATQ